MKLEIFCYTDFKTDTIDFYALEELEQRREPNKRFYRGIRICKERVHLIDLSATYPFPNTFEKVWFDDDKKEFVKRVKQMEKEIEYHYNIAELLKIIKEQG